MERERGRGGGREGDTRARLREVPFCGHFHLVLFIQQLAMLREERGGWGIKRKGGGGG